MLDVGKPLLNLALVVPQQQHRRPRHQGQEEAGEATAQGEGGNGGKGGKEGLLGRGGGGERRSRWG